MAASFRNFRRRNPETEILYSIRGVLISLGFTVLRVPPSIYSSQKGWPDLLAIKNGSVYFMEVKTERGRQSADQKRFQEIVENAGCKYFVLHSAKEAFEIFGGGRDV